ncbi:MAG: ABC transporter substrate-binding protein [Acidobacteriota bacterium]
MRKEGMADSLLLDRYELVEELGRGGMGVVYRARDPRLDREVAIKTIAPTALTEQAEARFRREARVAAGLDHPAIAPIFDFGRDGDYLFYVMPVVPGVTLQQLIRERQLTLGEIVEIGAQVADALDYSHARSVVHRDVKPENVMVERASSGVRIRVMDFGLAFRGGGDRLTDSGGVFGTLIYFSPERADDSNRVDGRSDLYALGVILYEALVGEPPFVGSPAQILRRISEEPPTPPSRLGVEIDEALEHLVLSCLEKDPGRRPQTGGELSRQLRAYGAALGGAERNRPWVGAPQTTSRPAMVGRSHEMARLERRVEMAARGQAQLVLVAGDAGIGKSRLLDELERWALERQVRVLRGRYSSMEEVHAPYEGYGELIRDAYRPREGTSTAPALDNLAGDLVALFPVLSELRGLRGGGSTPSRLADEAARQGDRGHIFELLARTLMRLAGERTTVMMLDDLHIADASIDALRYIVRRLAAEPILFIATYRPAEIGKDHRLEHLRQGFVSDPSFEDLSLKPLDRTEHRLLVAQLVDTPLLSEDLLSRLWHASEGNPFFTQELIRALLESDSVGIDETGAITLSQGIEISAATLPTTIQRAIERRLDQLPKRIAKVLGYAAVLGRTFDFEDLEALVGEDADVEPAVDHLIDAGILEEDTTTRGDRLIFTGALVRDVLYAELTRRRRRALHRRHARYLEKRWAPRLDRVYHQLVHHYAAGDAAEEAVRYGVAAGRQALDASCPEDAVRSVSKALEMVDDDLDEGRRREGELRKLLAVAFRQLGRLDEAHKEAARAVRAFEAAGLSEPEASAALLAAEVAWQSRRVHESRRWVTRGLGPARHGEDSATLRNLLTLGATVANLRGALDEAHRYLEEVATLDAETVARVPIRAGGSLVTVSHTAFRRPLPGTVWTAGEAELMRNVFDTLLTTDGEGNVIPVLCEHWQMRDEARCFRFTLRDGVCFSDGAPCDAAAVVAGLEQARLADVVRQTAAFAHIEAIEAIDRLTVEIRLDRRVPILPVQLTDPQAAIARYLPESALGTGPYCFASITSTRVVLERNPLDWRAQPAVLDRITWRLDLDSDEIAPALRRGEIDIAASLPVADLEALLRDSRFRTGLVERTKKNTYYVLFHLGGPISQSDIARRVLTGVLDTQTLVWRTFGRFVRPATTWLPPGVLGHDGSRRREVMSLETARRLLLDAGFETPIRLRVVFHPSFGGRYRPLAMAVIEQWRRIGVETEILGSGIEEILAAYQDPAAGEVDAIFGRWLPDYDDVDNFLSVSFDPVHGKLATLLADRPPANLAERLMAPRTEPWRERRHELAAAADRLITEEAHLAVPLFHEIDYRVADRRLTGLELTSVPPYVNWSSLAWTARPPQVVERAGTQLKVALPWIPDTIDPVLSIKVEEAEVIANVFETLTRVEEGSRVAPHLATGWTWEEPARVLRVKLRDDVRFHDGRRLTAHDVRFSFERLLRIVGERYTTVRLPILGASAVAKGEASHLEGLEILSESEVRFVLAEPIAFFPALLTNPITAIVPEGLQSVGANWRAAPGTGPFRLLRLIPGERVELEANPSYRKLDVPRVESLIFESLPAAQTAAALRAGRVSVVGNLPADDLDRLRHDTEWVTNYAESPRFSTCFLVLDCHQGPFVDPALRRALAAALDPAAMVTAIFGKRVVVAHGLIPPGLLGHGEHPRPEGDPSLLAGLVVRVGIHSCYSNDHATFWKRVRTVFGVHGIEVEMVTDDTNELLPRLGAGEIDLAATRWVAAYPDADTFTWVATDADGLIYSQVGDPDLSALAVEARVESDPALRHTLYSQIDRRLVNEARIIPLFHEQIYRVARTEVGSLRLRFGGPEVAYEELTWLG